MSNVIKFPNQGRVLTEETVTSNISNVKLVHINETLQTVIPILFSNIEIAGFDLSVDDNDEDDTDIKDGTLIVEVGLDVEAAPLLLLRHL